MVLRAHLNDHPKRHLDRFSRFSMGSKCYDAQCIVTGARKLLKLLLPLWDFVNPPQKDRATAIGNTHKNLVKIARVVREICSRTDRPIHRYIQTRHRCRERSNNVWLLSKPICMLSQCRWFHRWYFSKIIIMTSARVTWLHIGGIVL